MEELEKPSHPYLDFANDQHFINLAPKSIQDAILAIPNHYFEWNEKKILKEIYNGILDDSDFELRLSFWEEYERCFAKKIQMRAVNIYTGIIAQQTFNQNFLKDAGRVLFMVTEPSFHKKRQKYTHHLLLNEILDIAKKPVKEDPKTGFPDSNLMNLKLKAYQYIDQRLNGSIIQRVEQRVDQRSVNVNINQDSESPRAIPQSPEELDTRLNELMSQIQALPPAAETIMPTESVIKEAGRVVDAEFVRDDKRRDNSHKE